MDVYTYIPRTETQKKVLNKLLERIKNDNAILIGKYDTIRTLDIIHYMCGDCRKISYKLYKQLLDISGAFCKDCTYKKANEKRIVTVKEIHNVENISQIKEVKEKKEIKAKESGIIITKDEWIKRIIQKKLNEVWEYLFDEINGYDSPHKMRHILCGKVYEKSPRSHLNQDNIDNNGQGCIDCYHNSKRMTRNEFEKLSRAKYGDKFSGYENIPEIIPNIHTLISIICQNHGKIYTTYDTHLNGSGGCVPCSNNIKTKKEIINMYDDIFAKNGVKLLLDEYSDSDLIVLGRQYQAKCLKKDSHPLWYPTLANLIKANTGCPLCCNSCGYSKVELEWLEYCKIGRPNLHTIMSEGGQEKVGKFKVDGKEESRREAFEYNGCFVHGCTRCFPDRDIINPKYKKTYKVLYENTLEKKAYIEKEGYKYIVMWDHDWNMAKKAVKKIQQYWKEKNKKLISKK